MYGSTTNGDDKSAREPSDRLADVPRTSAPTRTFVFALASFALAIVCMLFALRYFVGERLPELNEAALEAAMAKWEKNGPKSYDMEIELRGARPGKIQIEVRDGDVTSHTRDGKVPNQSTWATWSVPGMFLDTLARDLQIAANPQEAIQAPPGVEWHLRCEFDPQFGYPATYQRVVTGGGPTVSWQVVTFQPK